MTGIEFNESEPIHPELEDTPESEPKGKAIWRKLRATRHFLFVMAIYATVHGGFEVGLLPDKWRPGFYETATSVTNIPAGGYICLALGLGVIVFWVFNGELNWLGRGLIMGLRAMWEEAGKDLERKIERKLIPKLEVQILNRITPEVTEKITTEVTEQVTAEAEKAQAEAVAKARAEGIAEGIAIGKSQQDKDSIP